MTYTGVSPGAVIEAQESTAARYVVAVIVVRQDTSTTDTESDSILGAGLAAQLNRIPDRCLSDVVIPLEESPSRAWSSLGQITGLLALGGGSVWAAWTLTRRARRSDPTDLWTP